MQLRAFITAVLKVGLFHAISAGCINPSDRKPSAVHIVE